MKNIKKNSRILLWMALTVIIFHLIIYVSSVASLALVTGGMKNKFKDIALEKHTLFLIWNNIIVLKGYLLICIGCCLAIFPALKFLLTKKEIISKRSVFGYTLLLTLILTLFSSLRVVHYSPYFLGNVNLGRSYSAALSLIPSAFRDSAIYFFFNIMPVILAVIVISYYLYNLNSLTKSRGILRGIFVAVCVITGIICLFSFTENILYKHAEADQKEKLNVLFLMSDSLRADHLSCNGYDRKTSPNIDKLASQSVNFTKCFTPIGSTVESLASMMSSQYPHTHGLQHMFPGRKQVSRFNEETRTLGEVLSEKGYRTIALGDWCAAVFKIISCGFDRMIVSDFDNFKVYMSEAVFMQHFILPLYFDNEFGYWLFPELEAFASYLTPRVVTNRVISEIDREVMNETPFFMTVFYSCTHLPYYSPYPYYQMYSDKDYRGSNQTHLNFPVDDFINGNFNGEFGEGEKQHVVDLYDGTVTEFDDCVGRIVEHLKKIGQLKNTVILISSDHGDDLFEPNTTIGHGLTFNGGDQSNNIPLILYIPGQEEKARKVEKICRSIDFAPTILDVLNYQIPESYEGVSLKPYTEGKKDLSLAFYGETSYLFFKRTIPGEETLYIPPMDRTTYIDENFDYHIVLKEKFSDDVIKTKERVLRTENYKIVYTPGKDHPIFRLYNIKKDPHCRKDVKNKQKKIYAKMKSNLLKWIKNKKETRISEMHINREI